MKADLMLATFASLELQKQKIVGQIHGISTKFACFNNKFIIISTLCVKMLHLAIHNNKKINNYQK